MADYTRKKKGEKVIVACRTCGKDICTWPSTIKQGGGKYCSRACYNESLRMHKTTTCLTCGKSFNIQPCQTRRGGGKYCSPRCYRNSRIGVPCSEERKRKISEAKKNRITKICLTCGKQFETIPSQIKEGRGKYCSHHCYGESLIGKNIGPLNNLWRGGMSYEPYTIEFTRELRLRIRKRDKYICQVCGKSKSKHVHHINYDKKDSRESNLITLCCSCHAHTNFQRGFWTGMLFTQLLIKYLIERNQ